MTPTAEQAAAIKAIVEWYGDPSRQEFYVAGFAGVGKSTVVAIAIAEIEKRYGGRKVVSGAFTGKAANVLRRKGAPNAMTIHRMIYMPKEDPETGRTVFMLAIDGPAASADLIVLDECSMVDDKMAGDLRSFGKKILVMGDPGQLPPVRGQGAFTARRPDVFLQEIHRQAADSPIIRLATLARQGKPLPVGDYGQGVQVLKLDGGTYHHVFDKGTQVLCGLHKVRWRITAMMRERLGFAGPLPLAGERLICRRNNYELGLFNGTLAHLGQDATEEDGYYRSTETAYRLTGLVDDDDNRAYATLDSHPWLFRQHFDASTPKPQRLDKGLNEFDWGYALTGHSAQGSQWVHCTIVDDSAAFREDRWKWLYTTLTRPESGMTVLLRDAA